MTEVDGIETNYIHMGDNVEFMRTLPNGCIDLTVTSPPYDNLRTYNGYSFDFESVANELYRITKDGGVVVWIVNDATIKGSETGTSFRQALYFKEIGFNLHDTMIWVKDGGGAIGSNKCYTQNFEYMFILTKGVPNTYNLIKDKVNLSFGVDKSGIGRRLKNGEHKVEKRKPAKKYSKRNNWWYIPPQKSKEHPAVFPYKLVEDHITSWSNEGDTIFDPFSGSGTTLIAALKNKRNFLGCEISSEYCELIDYKIREEMRSMTEIKSDLRELFDDITTGDEYNDWSQICNKCKVKLEIDDSLLDKNGSGICGVIGCNEESDYYVDFK